MVKWIDSGWSWFATTNNQQLSLMSVELSRRLCHSTYSKSGTVSHQSIIIPDIIELDELSVFGSAESTSWGLVTSNPTEHLNLYLN